MSTLLYEVTSVLFSCRLEAQLLVFSPPEFTVARAGYNMAIYYNHQLWVEMFQTPEPCKELKICNVIKGGHKLDASLEQELVYGLCFLFSRRSGIMPMLCYRNPERDVVAAC